MKIERRLFIEVKSHWSYVCILAEKFELAGWKVLFRPELNAIDIIKYRYDGFDVEDDMRKIIDQVQTNWGCIRAIYDLYDTERQVRWVE